MAGFGCVLACNLVQRVREAEADFPLVHVWREMKTMRAFDPMFSVLSVGELLLTPRGLVALAQRSLRSVHQQVKAIEDVGGELATGGRQLFGKPDQHEKR